MYTIQNNPRKMGRPPLYKDPIDVFSRVEREVADEISRRFPNVSTSRAVSIILTNYIKGDNENDAE